MFIFLHPFFLSRFYPGAGSSGYIVGSSGYIFGFMVVFFLYIPVKYYLYYLRNLGVDSILKGEIDYPKLRKRKTVELLDDDIETIEKILEKIERIINDLFVPERINKKICKIQLS